jgi:RimJ/RimL family protein N-acetyltransferase
VTELVPVSDADFEWMLGRAPSPRGLDLPPGGVDDPQTLAIVRRMNARLLERHGTGAWMMIHDSEVVGLCGYLRPPADSEVEIGFGVAASRRRLGHAATAIAAMLVAATDDPAVAAFVARTAVTNIGSQRALARNAFDQTGTERDDEDGEVIVWRRPIV